MSFSRHLLCSTISVITSLVVTISTASAERKELNLTLESVGTPSFETIMRQAQELAERSIQQEFAENSEVAELSITILGDRNGQIVPLLRSKVSRSQWQQDPRIYRWTKYFNNSGVLLGFYNPSSSAAPNVAPEPINRPSRVRLEDDPGFRDD
jgi:hypothetical protein